MKVNELMVGDWVYDSANECYVQVTYKDFRNDCIRILSDFKPIPITPEILEKNGFENQGYFGECILGDWRILCDTKNVDIIHGEHCNMDTPIEYVHELQHALRLCGIDKEIVL